MSPSKVYHSALQGEIAALLRLHRNDGKILTECAIQTGKETKVADVSWASRETYQKIKDETECSVAPEICVEVLSLSNTDEEIDEKRALYFEKGAKELWLCDHSGKIARSSLFPNFPQEIDLDA